MIQDHILSPRPVWTFIRFSAESMPVETELRRSQVRVRGLVSVASRVKYQLDTWRRKRRKFLFSAAVDSDTKCVTVPCPHTETHLNMVICVVLTLYHRTLALQVGTAVRLCSFRRCSCHFQIQFTCLCLLRILNVLLRVTTPKGREKGSLCSGAIKRDKVCWRCFVDALFQSCCDPGLHSRNGDLSKQGHQLFN